MRAGRLTLIAALGGFGLALFGLAIYHFLGVGSCASGNTPYVIQQPCPANIGYWFGSLFGSIILLVAGMALGGRKWLFGGLFVTGGLASLLSVLTGETSGSGGTLTGVILAVVFIPVGIFGFVKGDGSDEPLSTVDPDAIAADPQLGALASESRSVAGPALLAVVVAAAAAFGALQAALAFPGPLKVDDAYRNSGRPALASPFSGQSPSTGGAYAKVTAEDSRSWWRSANLYRALARIAAELGPRGWIQQMRLTPGEAQIDAVKGTTAHRYLMRTGEDTQVEIGQAVAGSQAYDLPAIDTHGPQRLLAELRRRFGLGASSIDYILLDIDTSTQKPRWLAYPKGRAAGHHYEAGENGTGIRKV